jgi:hypothetical protein
MVRKRFPWTRQRSKRSRPKTPAPKMGWVISELSRLTADQGVRGASNELMDFDRYRSQR